MSKRADGASPPQIPPKPLELEADQAGAGPLVLRADECIGKRVKCPECGAPTTVSNARGARTPSQVISSVWWVMLNCAGHCGRRLYKAKELLTVIDEVAPPPRPRTLGELIGTWIKCPTCGGKARAVWTLDDAHMIDCQECRSRPFPGDTIVQPFSE